MLKRIIVNYTFNSPRYWAGSCEDANSRGPTILNVNLRWHWKTAKRMAKKRHKNRFELFLTELIDTVVHEYAHAFEPARTLHKTGELLAREFAKCGLRTRL